MPGAIEVFDLSRLVPWFQGTSHYPCSAAGGVAVQPNAVKVHDQRIAGQSAFNIERPGKRIAPARAPHAVLVHSARIHSFGLDGVAGPDPEHGRDAARKLTMEFRGSELVNSRCIGWAHGWTARGPWEFVFIQLNGTR